MRFLFVILSLSFSIAGFSQGAGECHKTIDPGAFTPTIDDCWTWINTTSGVYWCFDGTNWIFCKREGLYKDPFGQVVQVDNGDTLIVDPFPSLEQDYCLLMIGEGQSNESGAASISDFSLEEQSRNENLFVLSRSSLDTFRFEPVDPSKGNHHPSGVTNEGGVILPMATYADSFFNAPIYYANLGYSGNSIERWMPSNNVIPLYEYSDRRKDFFRLAQVIQAENTCPLRIVHFWTQGEHDSQDSVKASLYASRLDTLLEDRRKIMGKIPTIAVLVRGDDGDYFWKDTVNQAMIDRAKTDPLFHVIDPEGFELQSDSVHYSVTGYRQLAQARIKIMKEIAPHGYEFNPVKCSSGHYNLDYFNRGDTLVAGDCFHPYRGIPYIDTIPGENGKLGITWERDSLMFARVEEPGYTLRLNYVPHYWQEYSVEWKMKYNGGDNASVCLHNSGSGVNGSEHYEFRMRNGTYFPISQRNGQTVISSNGSIDTEDMVTHHYRATIRNDYMILEESSDNGDTWTELKRDLVPEFDASKAQRLSGGTVLLKASESDGARSVFFWDIKIY